MRIGRFRGTWRLARRIEDHLAGAAARFEGRARLDPGPRGGLVYTETGRLTLGPGAPPMEATRRYLWEPCGETGILVRFDDGRFFHRIDLGSARPEAVHDCPPDRYRVAYDFSRFPLWSAEWRVSGPRKDYTSLSHFASAPECDVFARNHIPADAEERSWPDPQQTPS